MLFYVALASIYGATTIAVMQALFMVTRRPDRISIRLNKINPKTDRTKDGVDLLKEIEVDSSMFKNTPDRKIKAVRPNRLYLAGYRSRRDKNRLFVYKVILTSSFILITLWLKELEALSILQGFIGGLFSFILGWGIVPNLWLSARIKARQREIIANLADTLDLLVICLEAGLSFDAALVKVAVHQRRKSRIMSDELLYTNREILAGKPRVEALRSLSLRCGNQADIRSLVAVIIQAERFGSSLGQILRTQAELLRFKRRQRIKETIAKVPIKLLFPLVFCILPTIFIILVGPALMHILNNMSQIFH